MQTTDYLAFVTARLIRQPNARPGEIEELEGDDPIVTQECRRIVSAEIITAREDKRQFRI